MIRLIVLLSVAQAIVVCHVGLAAEPGSRPNVVLVMCDDLGWGDVGFNGNTVIRTPHLDAMAAAGLKFNRFYAAAPVCSPTRGSCLTGRHPYRYGIFFANVGHLPKEEFTLAEALRLKGYATGHFGKWHLGTLTKTLVEANRGGPRGAAHYAPPWERGFDTCFSTESKVPTWDPMLKPKGTVRNTWWDPVGDPSEGVPYGTHYWTNGRRVTENLAGANSRVIMDRAVPFIEEAVARRRPFFAVIWFHTPHLPVVAGPEYTRMYREHNKYAQHYYGCITAMDEQVGRLRKTLRDLKAVENTLVFFCSDNGPEGQEGRAPGSAGPFRGRKRSLYEGGVRVPALLEWPARVEAGRVTDFPACTSDYLPTVLDVLGFDSPRKVTPIDGVSLLPVREGRMAERPRPIGFESRGQVALSDSRYKLIHVPDRGRQARQTPTEDLRFELYDLIADPGESKDLAELHPELVRRMAATLAEWRRSCAASLSGADYQGPD
jgi:arylsulfatase A-like enzyme